MAITAPTYDLIKCAACFTNAAEKPLMTCVRCHSVMYCTKACQKTDWKAHKKHCDALANEYHNSSSASTSTQTNTDSDSKPFTAIYNNEFLHYRPQEQT